jgi:hypothetical protein
VRSPCKGGVGRRVSTSPLTCSRRARTRLPVHDDLTAVSERRLQFGITLGRAAAGVRQANRIFLRYASDADEAFWGFGAQMTYLDQKGRRLPNLVQERGVGRGLPVVTELVARADGPRTAGSPLTT